MKSFFLLIALSMISTSVFSAPPSLKENGSRPGFIESRQNKAREIMKENFRSINQIEKRSEPKSGLGFHKKIKNKKTQKI